MTKSLSERLNTLAARYPVDESLVFGLDVGIASVGSGAVRQCSSDSTIEFIGSRCFEAPENPKTRLLKNKTRREKRLLRRNTHRRRRRMIEIREILAAHSLLQTTDADAFHHRKDAPDPWLARAAGLDRKLNEAELAAALLHIAKHRGFKSNKKSDVGQNAPDDNKKMLTAITANKELLARYRTIGEMAVKDGAFSTRKRNKAGDYSHTFARQDLQDEAEKIFVAQRKLGNTKATAELEKDYIDIAFHQRPLQDSEHLVGLCPFEPDEKRSSRHAPSFEQFRFLAKLNTVKVRETDGSLRRLTGEELDDALSDFGVNSKSITWKALATKIGLSKGSFFDGVDERKASKDVAASKGCAAGTHTLYSVIGVTGWNACGADLALQDRVADVLSFREDLDSIEKGLTEIEGLEPPVLQVLIEAAREGRFGAFKGVGHISHKAARNLLPDLLKGLVYSEACDANEYDHTQTRKVEIDDIGNPVVRRSLREAVKQVETLIHHFGARPGRVIVELARQVGKSAEEREKMTRGIEKRTTEKERHRAQLKDLLKLGFEPSEEDLRRYELWKEQNYRCIYTDSEIPPNEILSRSNSIQVDHILPRSRSHDNSYANQVLCFAKANQDKGQRTPWEWWGRDQKDHDWWNAFEARVKALNIKGIKKRNLLMRNFDERQDGFVERNLNDTKYAARALLAALRELYLPEDEPDPASEGYLRKQRRLFARPGAITAILRRAWGLGHLKDRGDDRHHALDALICAAGSNEWLLNSLTRQFQQNEKENNAKWTPRVREPWPGFRDDAIRAYEKVFVSRSEKRRGRGKGHDDTIYSVGIEEDRIVTYERKAVANLSKTDLARLKDADGGNRPLAETLKAWIENGKPQDDPPRSPKGDPVRKVLLKRKGSDPSGLKLHGGHVDNADMVRVDVFAKPNKKGKDEYYLVPIYRHQVMNPRQWPEPPNRAVVIRKPTAEWLEIDKAYEFQFCMYPDTYLEVVTSNGEIAEGYFRGLNINDGGLRLSSNNLRQVRPRKFGSKTLHSLRKFHIDRLGGKHKVKRETRTWHGAACT